MTTFRGGRKGVQKYLHSLFAYGAYDRLEHISSQFTGALRSINSSAKRIAEFTASGHPAVGTRTDILPRIEGTLLYGLLIRLPIVTEPVEPAIVFEHSTFLRRNPITAEPPPP